MKIIADTNVLVRLVMADDEAQSRVAVATIEAASLVAIGIHALCELAWVLDRIYNVSRLDIAGAIRAIINASNVVINRPAIDAGLRVLDVGGEFADGVIAYDGQWLGGETFISFDRKAVRLLQDRGYAAELLQ